MLNVITEVPLLSLFCIPIQKIYAISTYKPLFFLCDPDSLLICNLFKAAQLNVNPSVLLIDNLMQSLLFFIYFPSVLLTPKCNAAFDMVNK